MKLATCLSSLDFLLVHLYLSLVKLLNLYILMYGDIFFNPLMVINIL